MYHSLMIRHLLFDLDNTLYPSTAVMDLGITTRMLNFVAEYLHLPLAEAKALRLSRLHKFGTTLEWLRIEQGLTDTDAYFAAVHPASETRELAFTAELRPFLQSLNMPMSVLTNSPLEHAVRVLDFFGIRDLFIGVYDLRFNKFRGKPWPDAYRLPIADAGFTVPETLFIDDHPKYARGYADIGGAAVLIDEKALYQDSPWPVLRSIYELPRWLQISQT